MKIVLSPVAEFLQVPPGAAVVALLELYQVPASTGDELLDLVRRSEERGWWTRQPGLPQPHDHTGKERGMPALDLSGARWHKSSRSTNISNCVEVAFAGPVVALRDSKNPTGSVLTIPHTPGPPSPPPYAPEREPAGGTSRCT